jgi:hypothetical protein
MLYVSCVFCITVLHLADQKLCNSVFLFCRSSQHEHGGGDEDDDEDDADHDNSNKINTNKRVKNNITLRMISSDDM